jgi:hypothetical protein
VPLPVCSSRVVKERSRDDGTTRGLAAGRAKTVMSFGSGQSYTDFGRTTGGTPAALKPFIEVMLRGIVGFRFAIPRLEGKWKMSQNRDKKDRDGVVQGLGKRRRSEDLGIGVFVLD